MEGYSVTEAASVLGVPTERIWELLARGVLSGAPEGETGMRVFLQPRPAPNASDPSRPNGHGTEPERELSPFRELLTEFRNLTERYGQALLALGESRGEVAALRSRVDLLEARMDLRLPGGSSWSPSPSFPAEHAVIPTAPEPAHSAPTVAPGADLPDERGEEEHRHRSRGPRRATESFAEALARADDPSPPELPRGLEAARTRQTDEATLPRDVPAADAVPVADEVAQADSLDTVQAAAAEHAATADAPPSATLEPEPTFADVVEGPAAPTEADAPAFEEDAYEATPSYESTAWARLDVDEPEVAHADEPEPRAEPWSPEATDTVETIEEPSPLAGSVDELTGDESSSGEEPAVERRDDEFAAAQEPAEAPATEEVAALEPDAEEEVAPEPAPLDWDAERYTTTIDEPDWFPAEVDDTVTAHPEPPSLASVSAIPAEEATEPPRAEAIEALPAMEESAPIPDATPAGPAPLPGSTELDRALDALRRQAMQASGDGDEWPPAPPGGGMSPISDTMAPPPVRPWTGPRSAMPPVTPAGRAYRRLRRIFPG